MKKKNLCGLGLLCVALAASACTIGDVEERAEVSMTTSTDVDPRPHFERADDGARCGC